MSEEQPQEGAFNAPRSRRRFVKQAAAGLVAAGAAPILAACGSSKSSSSSSSSTAAGSTSSASSTAASTSSSGSSGTSAALTAADGAKLRQVLGLPTGKAAGQGLSIPLGGDYALAGPASSYGLEQYHGVLMGVAAVKAAGGPDFQLKALNTIDAASGGTNVRQFGSAGITLVLTSQSGGIGAAIPFYPQYNMFAMDCGGATTLFASKPHFYQGSPERQGAFFHILLEYVKLKMPSVKTVGVIEGDYGPITAAFDKETDVLFAAAGMKGSYVHVPTTTSDFSSYISKLGTPDLVVCGIVSGTDMGLFMKQYANANAKAPVVGLDYTVGAAKVAGPAFGDNFYFSAQYFQPTTTWGKLFADEFQRNFHYAPNYYNANYYQAVFWYWEMARRVIAAGGDPTKPRNGDAYIKAFESKPEFPSVYGLSGTTGTATFDVATHTLSHQLMVFGKGGTNLNPTILATADVTGEDFKLTNASA